MCHYFTKLQEHQQAQREEQRRRRQHQRSSGSGAAEDRPTTSSEAAAMDMDSTAAAPGGTQADTADPAAAGGAAAGGTGAGLARSELVDGLRHVFAVLSMLAAAQPSAVKAKYVPVLLEVAFSPDLAVSVADHKHNAWAGQGGLTLVAGQKRESAPFWLLIAHYTPVYREGTMSSNTT
jgi:hypothetical protein